MNEFERPKILKCKIIRYEESLEIKSYGKLTSLIINRWIIFVSYKNNKPYEIFYGEQEDDMLYMPKMIMEGQICKRTENKNNYYDFTYQDKHGSKVNIENISERVHGSCKNYGMFISKMMRWNVPIKEIHKIVKRIILESDIDMSWTRAIQYALQLLENE